MQPRPRTQHGHATRTPPLRPAASSSAAAASSASPRRTTSRPQRACRARWWSGMRSPAPPAARRAASSPWTGMTGPRCAPRRLPGERAREGARAAGRAEHAECACWRRARKEAHVRGAEPPGSITPPHRRPPCQVGRLARKSYQLHAELAAAFGAAAIGYRTVSTLSVAAVQRPAGRGGGASARKRLEAPLPAWLDGEGILQSSSIGTPATTAQARGRGPLCAPRHRALAGCRRRLCFAVGPGRIAPWSDRTGRLLTCPHDPGLSFSFHLCPLPPSRFATPRPPPTGAPSPADARAVGRGRGGGRAARARRRQRPRV
jgi:hypothetical protein